MIKPDHFSALCALRSPSAAVGADAATVPVANPGPSTATPAQPAPSFFQAHKVDFAVIAAAVGIPALLLALRAGSDDKKLARINKRQAEIDAAEAAGRQEERQRWFDSFEASYGHRPSTSVEAGTLSVLHSLDEDEADTGEYDEPSGIASVSDASLNHFSR